MPTPRLYKFPDTENNTGPKLGQLIEIAVGGFGGILKVSEVCYAEVVVLSAFPILEISCVCHQLDSLHAWEIFKVELKCDGIPRFFIIQKVALSDSELYFLSRVLIKLSSWLLIIAPFCR